MYIYIRAYIHAYIHVYIYTYIEVHTWSTTSSHAVRTAVSTCALSASNLARSAFCTDACVSANTSMSTALAYVLADADADVEVDVDAVDGVGESSGREIMPAWRRGAQAVRTVSNAVRRGSENRKKVACRRSLATTRFELRMSFFHTMNDWERGMDGCKVRINVG